MTQEEIVSLIKKAQAGDAEAKEKIYIAYGNLVRSIARSKTLVGADTDYDDLSQIGCFGLLRAIDTFNVDGGASFKTYASTCIENAILDELRKKRLATETIDAENPLINAIPASSDPESDVINVETATKLYSAIRAELTDVEFAVLNLYIEGLTYQEISARLDLQKKKVDNTIYSIKKKIKTLLHK